MNTLNTIESILKAPVPTSILDSGGAYGYQFERNQKTDLKSQPRVSHDIWIPKDRKPTSQDIEAHVNIYHYLTEWLHTDHVTESLNKQLRKRNIHWTGEAIEYIETLPNIYKVGNEINTYNGEQILSQVIQYFTFEFTDSTSNYVGLQIHGGCDVRGGYSDCQIFELNSFDWELFGHTHIYGQIDGHNVSTCYDGYSLLSDETGEPVPLKMKGGDVISKIELDFYQ